MACSADVSADGGDGDGGGAMKRRRKEVS